MPSFYDEEEELEVIPYPPHLPAYFNGVFCTVIQGLCECGNVHAKDEWEIEHTIHDEHGRLVFSSRDPTQRDKANEHWKGTPGQMMTARTITPDNDHLE